VGWAGQLAQLAALLESDPEAGMQSLGGFIRPMCSSRPEDDPSQYDREMPDEHGPMNLNESSVIAAVARMQVKHDTAECAAEAAREGGWHTYEACSCICHALEPTLTEYEKMRREMLADEAEMDML
jgi:hypothetical protein